MDQRLVESSFERIRCIIMLVEIDLNMCLERRVKGLAMRRMSNWIDDQMDGLRMIAVNHPQPEFDL